MSALLRPLVLSAVCVLLPAALPAQDPAQPAAPDAPGLDAVAPEGAETETPPQQPAEEPRRQAVRETAEQLASDTREKVQEIAGRVDQMEEAKEVSAGLLQPIYLLAESMSFPAFHWLAFTLMAAGVVGFALQLVLGKLVLLSKLSLNIREILSDGIGLLISLIGLVLTTQAAAQNSTFTNSPAAVLSAAIVGVIVGLVLYKWGQSQEVQAALGRTQKARQTR